MTKEELKRALEEQYGGEEEVCPVVGAEIGLLLFLILNVGAVLFRSCNVAQFFPPSLVLMKKLWCFVSYLWLQLPQTNPGFNNIPFKFTKYSNAYMLVYIRECDKDKVICNVDEKDIAEHLQVGSRRLFHLAESAAGALLPESPRMSSSRCEKGLLMNLTNFYDLSVLQVRLKKEQEEKERKRKEKAEAHLYTIIKVNCGCCGWS